VLSLSKQHYADYGPTLANEKLHHVIRLRCIPRSCVYGCANFDCPTSSGKPDRTSTGGHGGAAFGEMAGCGPSRPAWALALSSSHDAIRPTAGNSQQIMFQPRAASVSPCLQCGNGWIVKGEFDRAIVDFNLALDFGRNFCRGLLQPCGRSMPPSDEPADPRGNNSSGDITIGPGCKPVDLLAERDESKTAVSIPSCCGSVTAPEPPAEPSSK
jgi:hypothetical protein